MDQGFTAYVVGVWVVIGCGVGLLVGFILASLLIVSLAILTMGASDHNTQSGDILIATAAVAAPRARSSATARASLARSSTASTCMSRCRGPMP